MSAFAVWVGSRNHSIQTVSVRGPSLGPRCPQPLQAIPPLFFLQPTYHDFIGLRGAGEGDGAGGGELARSWRPLLRDVFNYNFLKSLFRGFGAFKFFLLPPPPPLNRWTKLEWGFPCVSPLPSSLQTLTLLLTAGAGGVGVLSSRSHPPKPSPSDAGCVPAPGPGLELGKAKLVVG